MSKRHNKSNSSSDESSSSSSEQINKKQKPDTYTHDKDLPSLVVPKFAYDGATRESIDKAKADVRKKRFFGDYEAEVEAIKEARFRYDPLVALGAKEAEETPEEAWNGYPKASQRPEDPLFALDQKTGKMIVKKEPDIRQTTDLHMIPSDGTVVLAGIRRSGKSWALRCILYHMRHLMSKGLVFSATRFNGFWRRHIPNAYIHEEFDGDVLQAFMDWRGKQVEEFQRAFGSDARDEQNFFIILDDCVDQHTRYDQVLILYAIGSVSSTTFTSTTLSLGLRSTTPLTKGSGSLRLRTGPKAGDPKRVCGCGGKGDMLDSLIVPNTTSSLFVYLRAGSRSSSGFFTEEGTTTR